MKPSRLWEVVGKDLEASGLRRWTWKYMITNRLTYAIFLLRLAEYCQDRTLLRGLPYYYARWRYERLSEHLGLSIPLNVFGPGLSVAHRGSIVVNGEASVGRNCRIHQNVTIGAKHGLAPHIGDDVWIGPGAGIYGPVEIGDRAIIGPHALVDFDVPPDGVVVSTRATIRDA